ncbi:MAG: hypothetical protein A2V98_17015 [Planctomycetes bacterium RBG_16_64_12]|nr:MAG: hypothetical protein A2V98_17015 [Planctomycetes bacterium RBG_16_64_12]
MLFRLIAAGVVLLISTLVALGLAELLAALNDQLGAKAVKYVALGCGVLFVIDLICLVLAQAVNSLDESDDSSDAN